MGSLTDRVNVGVEAVVTDDEGRFLLCKRLAPKHGQYTWAFPGGKPDPGESPADACIRELAEETGIVVDFVQPLGVWTYDRFEDWGVHYVTLYFLVDAGGQEPQNLEPEKHGDWEWLEKDDAMERPLFSGAAYIMELMS